MSNPLMDALRLDDLQLLGNASALHNELKQVCAELKALHAVQRETRDAVLRLTELSGQLHLPKVEGKPCPSELPSSQLSRWWSCDQVEPSVEAEVYETLVESQPIAALFLPKQWPAVPLRRGLGGPGLLSSEEVEVLVKATSSQDVLGSSILPARVRSKRWVIVPHSTCHMTFLLFALLLVTMDCALIPMTLAWSVDDKSWFVPYLWMSVIFWTVDMLVNFVTGYQHGGEEVLSWTRTSARYLRGWCSFDALVLGCDWVNTIAETVADPKMEIPEMFRVGRLLRLVRLSRYIRFAQILEEVADRFAPEAFRNVVGIFAVVLSVLLLTHMISCMWCAIARLPSDTGRHWTRQGESPPMSSTYMYTTAFHWTFAQLTLNSIEDVEAASSLERVFNVVLSLLALVFNSLLVSTLSAMLIGLQISTQDVSSKIRTLGVFLRQNRVDARLSKSVKDQVSTRIRKVNLLTEEDVPALSLLSCSLRAQLHFARSKPSLLNHSLFRLWINLSDRTAAGICTEAVTFKILNAGDDLFMAGSSSVHAYFLVRDALEYHQDPETSPVSEPITAHVTKGSWICEAALWTEWQHVGTASTSVVCQLMAIHGERLVVSLGKHRVIRDITQQYAQQFQRRLAAAVAPHWPSDIWVPCTSFGRVVRSMDHNLQALIGLTSLQELPWVFDKFLSFDTESLRKEVEMGKCAVVVGCDGSVERIVCVVVLRLEHHDGCLLAQLGYFDRGSFTVACQLPGTKMERGETPQDCLTRVLSTRLHVLSDSVQLMHLLAEEEYEEMSVKFRVKTRYFRSAFCAQVSGPLFVPLVFSSLSDRETTKGTSYEHDPSLVEILPTEACAIQWDDGRVGIYVWTRECELAILKAPRSRRMVEEWAKTLFLDKKILEERSFWRIRKRDPSTGSSTSSATPEVPEEFDHHAWPRPDMVKVPRRLRLLSAQ